MKMTSKIKTPLKMKTTLEIVPSPKKKLLYTYIGVGARDLYVDEAHMTLDKVGSSMKLCTTFVLFYKGGAHADCTDLGGFESNIEKDLMNLKPYYAISNKLQKLSPDWAQLCPKLLML